MVTPHFLCIKCVYLLWPELWPPFRMQNRVTWKCSRGQLAEKWVFHVVLLLISYISAGPLWFRPPVVGSHCVVLAYNWANGPILPNHEKKAHTHTHTHTNQRPSKQCVGQNVNLDVGRLGTSLISHACRQFKVSFGMHTHPEAHTLTHSHTHTHVLGQRVSYIDN